MVQIAICDDNNNDLSMLMQLVNQYRESKHLHCEYALFPNGFELISALEKGNRFDIHCLDIVMPAFSGIEVAQEIRRFDKSVPILFFTSSPEFALESYSVKAIDYILKPFSKEKFFVALDEALERIKIEQEDAILVKSIEGIQRILISNLVFVQVYGRSVSYYLLNGKVVTCTDSFGTVCNNLLHYGCFLKTHRSYLVNMMYIDAIESHQVTLQTVASVPIAQGKAKEIKERYLAFQMESNYPNG